MNADKKFFLDTNIFVYTFDDTAPEKQKTANELIQLAAASGNGRISGQVIQEFLFVASRRFATPLPLSEAQKYLTDVLEPLCHCFPSMSLYKDALAILGGVFEGRYMDGVEMTEVATIPPRETLLAQIAQLLNSPISRLAIGLNQIAEKRSV